MNRLIDCKEATRLISQGMDRQLPLVSRLVLRVHLLACDYCRRFEKQAELLREAVQRYRR